jgi:hypothetical protein
MVQNGMESKWPGLSLGPGLTEQQAREIFALGQGAVVFALLRQAQMLIIPPAAYNRYFHGDLLRTKPGKDKSPESAAPRNKAQARTKPPSDPARAIRPMLVLLRISDKLRRNDKPAHSPPATKSCNERTAHRREADMD